MFFPHAPTSLNAFEILTAQHMGYLRRVTISGDNWGREKNLRNKYLKCYVWRKCVKSFKENV